MRQGTTNPYGWLNRLLKQNWNGRIQNLQAQMFSDDAVGLCVLQSVDEDEENGDYEHDQDDDDYDDDDDDDDDDDYDDADDDDEAYW